MQEHELIIIGLGISGIALAKEASKNNIDYLVLEKIKNSEVYGLMHHIILLYKHIKIIMVIKIQKYLIHIVIILVKMKS